MKEPCFEVGYVEDAPVAYLGAFAGGKYLYVSPAALERVTERNDITQLQNRAVGFISHSVDELKIPLRVAPCELYPIEFFVDVIFLLS